jgi:cell division initiation protein
MITPVDLETTVFRRGFRGYNVGEVQEFMLRITHDYEHLYRENIELKEQIETLQNQLGKYREMEETLRNAMVLAQKSADEVKNVAQAKANLIIKEAEQRGELVKIRLKEEIQLEVGKLTELRQHVDLFKCQFKSFLTGLMEIAEHKMDLHIPWDKIFTRSEAREATTSDAAEEQIRQQVAETAGAAEPKPED